VFPGVTRYDDPAQVLGLALDPVGQRRGAPEQVGSLARIRLREDRMRLRRNLRMSDRRLHRGLMLVRQRAIDHTSVKFSDGKVSGIQ
jgi:hypothetical protein